jgi:hypothetical protein
MCRGCRALRAWLSPRGGRLEAQVTGEHGELCIPRERRCSVAQDPDHSRTKLAAITDSTLVFADQRSRHACTSSRPRICCVPDGGRLHRSRAPPLAPSQGKRPGHGRHDRCGGRMWSHETGGVSPSSASGRRSSCVPPPTAAASTADAAAETPTAVSSERTAPACSPKVITGRGPSPSTSPLPTTTGPPSGEAASPAPTPRRPRCGRSWRARPADSTPTRTRPSPTTSTPG